MRCQPRLPFLTHLKFLTCLKFLTRLSHLHLTCLSCLSYRRLTCLSRLIPTGLSQRLLCHPARLQLPRRPLLVLSQRFQHRCLRPLLWPLQG